MSQPVDAAPLQPYDPGVFNELLDFHIAREDLPRYRESLSVLGGIICKYNFEDVVGIKLLHKHFDLEDHEILVRNFVSVREARTAPVERSNSPENIIPYMWMFSGPPSRDSGWYPVEFMTWTDGRCSDLDLLQSAHGFLAELGETISELDFQFKFGLIGLYSQRGFVLDSDETTVENTDMSTRTLTLKVMANDSAGMEDTTFTTWLYSQPEPPR